MCVVLVFWITEGWIVEFTIVVFGVEVLLNLFGSSKEVFHISIVGYVEVEVILEVFKHVHVVVDEVVSSNSWERESLVIKIPGMNLQF